MQQAPRQLGRSSTVQTLEQAPPLGDWPIAEASRRAVEESSRAAQSARREAQRTRIGLLVSLALALLAATFGAYALNQKKSAEVANASLENANKDLALANDLAETGRNAARRMRRSERRSTKALAEARREAAEKTLDLMLQQLIIKATFESVQARESFRMAQVRAKGQDDEFQEALRVAGDPDDIWMRLARVLVEFAENPPSQLRGYNKEREWAEHAQLVITRVVARRGTPEWKVLNRQIMDALGR